MPLCSTDVQLHLAFPEHATEATLQRWTALLSPNEIARRERFHFASDRLLYLAAHGLVREALSSQEPAILPESWRFVTSPHGRPEIAPDLAAQPLRFNLTHTRGLVACAITVAREVGVDAERVEGRVVDPDLARRVFSADEVRALEALPEPLQRERFFRLWTLKEAYIKARGLGLSLPLDQFSFDCEDDEGGPGAGPSIRIRMDGVLADTADSWHFELFRPTAEHLLALAVRRRPDEALRVHVEP